MGREPLLIAGCGMKGIGKTVTTVEYIRSYVKGNPDKQIPGRKVLIFDVNNEYSDKQKYPDVSAIFMRDLATFAASNAPQIKRIRPFFDNNEKMTLSEMAEVLKWIVRTFFNGLLLIEDINLYVYDNMPGDLIGSICTNRHTGLDIILHYQSIGRLTPKVWQNVNYVRLHKNMDSIKRHENKIPDKFECLCIAEKIIEKKIKEDKYFYLWVDTMIQKIHADVPDKVIKECVTEYVEDNYSKLISPLLIKQNREGKKVHTPASAFDFEEKRIYEAYFTM